jgi:hypothetical protein
MGSRMTNTAAIQSIIDAVDLDRVTGGAGGGNMPLGGNVTQQINTNWGGTQVINPPAERPSPLRFEQLRQDPRLRFGPPPFVNRPIRRR